MPLGKQEEKPKISQLYVVGDFIDAKDNQGDWRVGFIVDKSEVMKTFKVRFDGWSSKYDEFYRFGHPKLRQFRSMVVGYTGQKQLAALRQGWKFSLQEHQNRLVELHAYVAKNSQEKVKSAHEVNQWIRGHNYFYVDFLMTVTYSSVQELHKVIEFFKLNILLCVKYLKDINQHFDQFIENIQKNNNEHLNNIDVAHSCAFYQIFDMVYIIAGGYQRMAQFFKDNSDLLRKEFQLQPNRDVKMHYQVKIVDYFYRNGGFELIDMLLKKIYKLNKSLPFVFLYSFAHLYAGVSNVLQAKSRQSVVNQFRLINNKSLQYLGDKQMKDLLHHEVIDCIGQIVYFSKKTTIEQSTQSWGREAQMQVYFKMITCPYFEKKLRGITSLQQFIQKNVETKKQEEKTDIISDGSLLAWIEQKKLFDVLFSQDNPQLIKKSTELIKYLYHRQSSMQKYVSLVWRYRQNKHQTALKQIYTFIGDIPIYDKKESFTIELFNQHLSKVDETLIDADYIKMIKDYTVNALNNLDSKDITHTFGFRMIYNYLQKNQNDENLITYLIQILEKLKESQLLQSFIADCFKAIHKQLHPKFHISLLLKILREKLTDLRTIKLDCRSILQQNIVASKDSLKQNLQQQFQLLSQYLKQAKEIIPQQNFIDFWNQMIDSKGRVEFFKWLYKVRDSGKVMLSSFVKFETKEFLLYNFWTDQYLEQHQIDQYEATFLLQLFKFVNDKEDRIRRSNVIIEVVDQQLTGVQKLHSAYLHSNDPKTTQILAKGLTEIYTSGSESLQELNINLLQDFIQKIVILIRQYSDKQNIEGVNKMIRLIQELILRDQQMFDVVQKVRMEAGKNILVKNLQTKDEKVLRVNMLQNVYTIKKLIADKFNLSLHKFDLILNEEQIITYKSYFEPLGELDKKGKILIKYRPEHPSLTKTELNLHLELLFELLDNKALEERVWNVVSKLPISDQIREKIMLSQNPLLILSNENSFYKQLYMFKAALSIPNKWWTIDNQQMINFFLTRLQNTKGTTEIHRQYIMVAGKLLEQVIKQDPPKNDKLFTHTFLAVFQIMKRLIIQSSQLQNLNVLYVKKFLETFFAVGQQLNNFLAQNSLITKQPDALSLMLADPHIEKLFKLCLIEYKHEAIRREFPARLAQLSKCNKEKYATRLAGIVLDELLDATVQSQTKTLAQYIQFGCFILESMDGFLKGFYAQKKSIYFYKLFKLIDGQQGQKSSESINLQLQCYLSIVRYVLKQISPQQLSQFLKYLYSQCLFKGNESKCKSKQTKNSVFNIFIRVIKYSPKVQQLVYLAFSRLHQNGLWRTRRLEDWTITHSERLKSALNYVGLRNLGCICYMNSFFQQIFMIQEFRQALLRAEDPEYNAETKEENVLYQVKKMFLNLMYSDKKAYNPKSFCMSLKDYEGNATNVNEQMDIDQFSGILFDRLQNQLKGTSQSTLIKDTFGGIYSNEIICKGCPHFSQSQESFLSLSLTVKDKRSIYESLETMIKGDMLDGDNAYYCQRCDKKVSAVKRVCLKKLPDYLMVALKRFQFDYNTMTKLKLNGFCEFPAELNLEEYSYDYLRKRDNPKELQEGEQLKSKKYYQYKLKGVVIHIGYADSGHYYSLIQERTGEQRWIQFNDTAVRKFNIDNLNDQAFGGQTGGLESKQKIKNAYMLIYERVEKLNSPHQRQTIKQPITNIPMYEQALETIKTENLQYNIENVLFSAEYIKFIQSLIQQAGRNKENLPLQKFIILAFLTVIIRSKTTPDMFDILKTMYNSCCKGNQKLCEFVLEQFCDAKIYQELFRNCPIREIKRNLTSWTCLLLSETKNEKLKERFLRMVVYKIMKQNENNIEALGMLYNLVDEEYCYKFLVQNNLVGRLLQNIIRRDPRCFGSVEGLEPVDLKENVSFLGYEQVIEKSAFELKKIKYDNESGYVWAVINKITKRLRPQQLSSILHPKQIEYLYLSRDKIYKLLQQAKTKFDIDALTSYLCYLSHNNPQFIKMLLQLIEKGLKEFQSKRYRQFFELYAKLLIVQDQFANERVTGILCILRSLKENEKYAMDCTIIQLWICKIVNQSQTLRAYLIKEKTILKYLADLPLKKVPSDQLSKKNIVFTEASVNKFHGIPFPSSRRGYVKLLRHVEQFYEKLLTNEYQPIHYFQSGNHVTNDKLAQGGKIAYFDIKDKIEFEQALVKEVFVDRLLILRKGTNKSFWIWSDDQKLTANPKVIKDQNAHDLDSSKTTEMEDEIDFQAVN